MARSWIQFGAPLVTLLLLAGMTTADKLRIDPHESDGYHSRAAVAIAKVPKVFGTSNQTWFQTGKDILLPDDAAGMLKPNAYLHRLYMNPSTGRRVEILLVQCRDTRDMQGHYPPICYPSSGCSIDHGITQTWQAGSLSITGVEYVVTRPNSQILIIRNFFVLPNGKIVRDMDSVVAAAKDYRELVYGVAQIQLLFDASVGEVERNQIFAQMMGSNQDLLGSLRSGTTGGQK